MLVTFKSDIVPTYNFPTSGPEIEALIGFSLTKVGSFYVRSSGYEFY